MNYDPNLHLEYRKAYQKNKWRTDERYRAVQNANTLCSKMYRSQVLNFNKRMQCTSTEFIKHIESFFNFENGFTSHNYGLRWSIDHIIPLRTAYDNGIFEKAEHYLNCRPVLRSKNAKEKTGKIFHDGLCARCKVNKKAPLKDSEYTYCGPCRNEIQKTEPYQIKIKARYARNTKDPEWRKKQCEAVTAHRKRKQQEDREAWRAKQREYYHRHKDKIKARREKVKDAYSSNNPDAQ